MRARLERVRKRCELGRLAARAMGERLLEQPVGEPRVARQERAVEIGADRATDAAAFVAALAVVPEAGDDAAERLGTGIEPRAARVVLEAGERLPVARLELALEQDVADHPPLARDGLERQQADARHVLAVEAAVAAPEQLVAAAHREQCGAAADDRLVQRLRLRGEVLGDEQLLTVLAAADVVEVVRAGDDRVVHADAASRRARARARPPGGRTRRCCRGRRRC